MKSKFYPQGEKGTYELFPNKKILRMVFTTEGIKTVEDLKILSFSSSNIELEQEIEGQGSLTLTLEKKK